MKHRMRALRAPAAFIAISLLPGLASAGVTRQATEGWYRRICKPRWNPPPWLFGPVWTVLYLLIAAAGHLLWRRRTERGAKAALALWGAQMTLNHAWSPIFFGRRRIGLAAFEVTAMWAAIVACIAASRRVSRLASMLLLPYLAWVSFAAALNIRVWALNRGAEADAIPTEH